MREIKFRLRTEIDIVGYEKWYAGERKNFTASPLWLYSRDGNRWNPDYIFHVLKDQYTGLKDKSGKEIYEGDIIKRYPLIPLYTVEWINQSGGWFLVHKDMRMPLSEMYLSIMEIIGNIYSNPELLGASNVPKMR